MYFLHFMIARLLFIIHRSGSEVTWTLNLLVNIFNVLQCRYFKFISMMFIHTSSFFAVCLATATVL